MSTDEEVSPTPESRFAANMRAMREALGWNQSELARRLTEAGLEGFHQTTISRIEKGERPIRLGEATVAAQVFQVPVERLAGDGSDLAALALIRSTLARTRKAEAVLLNALAEFEQAIRELRTAVGDPDVWADGDVHSPWTDHGYGDDPWTRVLVDGGYPDERSDAPARVARRMLTELERDAAHDYLNATTEDVRRKYEEPAF